MSSLLDLHNGKYFYNGNNDYYKKINSHTLKKYQKMNFIKNLNIILK